jgi:hypothetical protein
LVRISLKSARTQAFLKRKVSSFLYLAWCNSIRWNSCVLIIIGTLSISSFKEKEKG